MAALALRTGSWDVDASCIFTTSTTERTKGLVDSELDEWASGVRASLSPLFGRTVRVKNPGLTEQAWRDSQCIGWVLGLTGPPVSEKAAGKCSDEQTHKLIWLRVVLELMAEVWSRGEGDPRIDMDEFAHAWGDEAEEIARKSAPTGMGRWFFTAGARRRYLKRLHANLPIIEASQGFLNP